MPAQVKITLTNQEEKHLIHLVNSRKTPVRLVDRANIVLMAAAKNPNYKIAEALGIDVNTVGRWRNRYAKDGLKGIEKDLPRGRNHGGKNTDDQNRLRSEVIRITTQE